MAALSRPMLDESAPDGSLQVRQVVTPKVSACHTTLHPHVPMNLPSRLTHIPLQCAVIRVTDIAQQTIHQLQLNQQPSAASDNGDDATRMLAVRCTCCVAVLRLLPPRHQ